MVIRQIGNKVCWYYKGHHYETKGFSPNFASDIKRIDELLFPLKQKTVDFLMISGGTEVNQFA